MASNEMPGPVETLSLMSVARIASSSAFGSVEAAHTKAFPEINLNTNHVYTFEALLVAADAFKRAGSSEPKALADAIRATSIKDNVSPGPGIQFDAKGQNAQLKNSAIQNRGGKLVTVAPKGATNAKAEWPITPYDKRG